MREKKLLSEGRDVSEATHGLTNLGGQEGLSKAEQDLKAWREKKQAHKDSAEERKSQFLKQEEDHKQALNVAKSELVQKRLDLLHKINEKAGGHYNHETGQIEQLNPKGPGDPSTDGGRTQGAVAGAMNEAQQVELADAQVRAENLLNQLIMAGLNDKQQDMVGEVAEVLGSRRIFHFPPLFL